MFIPLMNILDSTATQLLNNQQYMLIGHIVIIAISLIVILYISYLIITQIRLLRYKKELYNEINSEAHQYTTMKQICNSVELVFSNKLYIIKNKELLLFIKMAKEIDTFKTDLINLNVYISRKDYYSSNKIILKYKCQRDKKYLSEEYELFDSLYEKFRIQDEELRHLFAAEVEQLSKSVRYSSRTSLENAKSIETAVLKIVQRSKDVRYFNYIENVQKLKYHTDKLMSQITERNKAEATAKQQIIINEKTEGLISRFQEFINAKNIDEADKILLTIDKNIALCDSLNLKQTFNYVKNDYIEQKKRGVCVFEKECYVNYSLKYVQSQTYPIIRTPNKGCIVWPHRRKQIARRGYTEAIFQRYLDHYFSGICEILGDVNILPQSDCKPYEPDIAIVDIKSGYNLRIDVEIDEPYAGLSNLPTHYIGCGDEYRDANLNNLGWMVARFSEYQIQKQPLNCVAYISRIINSIIPNANIDSQLLKLADPNAEKQWDRIDAQKWATQKYRQTYLNHEFGVVDNNELTNIDIKLSAFEQSILSKVEHTNNAYRPAPSIAYNKENICAKDEEIQFNEANHIYTYKGINLKAVSTIISEFFPVFDQQYWAEIKARQAGIPTKHMIELWENKGNFSREVGTFLHNQIENYYLGLSIKYIYDYIYKGVFEKDKRQYNIEPKEFKYFLNFERDRQIKPFRTEWRIFNKQLNIAGTIDLITKNGDKYDIYDWKRSDKIFKDNIYQCGLGGLSHLQDTRLNHYIIQQNLYRWILENSYNITIDNMYLVVLHSSFDNYNIIEVPRMDKEVKYIIGNL